MRRKQMQVTLLMITFLIFLAPFSAFSSSCTTATLQDYISLGVRGCSIDDKQFSNFGYAATSTGGGSLLPASGISVTPQNTFLNPTLSFDGLFVALANERVDGVISFQVNANSLDFPIVGLTLVQGGTVVSGTGIASIGETACIGNLFSNACSGSFVASLQTFGLGTGIPPAQLVDHVDFSPTLTVDVIKDIGVFGGRNGFALLSHVENQFSSMPPSSPSEVPEPVTLLSFGTGLLAVILLAFRNNARKEHN